MFHSKDKAKYATELCSQFNQPLLQKKVSSGLAGVNVAEKSDSNLVRSNENTQKPSHDGNIIAASTHGAGSNAGANVVRFCLFLSSSFISFFSIFLFHKFFFPPSFSKIKASNCIFLIVLFSLVKDIFELSELLELL